MSRRYVVLALIVSTFSCADDESSQRREEEWIREPELGAAAATALGTGENQSGPLAPAVTTSAQAIRFLEQATFGPKPNRIAHVVDIGITAAIDEELNRAAGEFAPTPRSTYSM
jgi:hypothetical protein